MIIIEKSKDAYGAFSPDITGCVAIGASLREVKKLIRVAIEFHIEGLRSDGLEIPSTSSKANYLKVAA